MKMATVHQHDSNGYYLGETDDYGGAIPQNCVSVAPTVQDGFIPRWNGKTWDQVESHKGKKGYVDGMPHEIKEHGPYPDGWSAEPPPPTKFQQIQQVQSGYRSALNSLISAYNAAVMLGDTDDAAVIKEEYAEVLGQMQAEIAAITG